jgi:hypothetical protein
MNTLVNRLMTVDEAAKLIAAGRFLMLAGDEALLRGLPSGNWIGGTIPYFMAEHGGLATRALLFVTEIPATADAPEIRLYDITDLEHVCEDGPANGFSLIIIPAFSGTHSLYARKAPDFADMFVKPIVGWIAGSHLDDFGKVAPLVVSGPARTFDGERAVVMHVPLPESAFARIEIFNTLQQGKGDSLRFPETGFSASRCRVNGVDTDFAAYLEVREADVRLPLVADYGGASVNVSIKGVDPAAGRVDFYAPVFDDVEYRLAAPADFNLARGAEVDHPPLWSCNCILNYLYCGLEGRTTGALTGPMTFGEIAYLLLNQTQVYLSIEQI